MAGHDKTTAAGKKLFKELKELSEMQVRVGFQRGKKHKGKGKRAGADLVDIALYNELGTDTIPSRPFLAQTVAQQGDAIKKASAEWIMQVAEGKLSRMQALKNIGVLVKGAIQHQMAEGEFAPNTPSTIRKKGSDKPLIDTGQLRQGVSYKICRKGKYDDV